MHLTNYSLNVHSGNFVHSESQSTGSKRTLSSVLYRLAAKGVDIKKVWSDIIALVIKTLIAVVPELKVYYHAEIPPGKPGPTCFQVSSVRPVPDQHFPSIMGRFSFIFKGLCCAVGQILGFDILLMKNLKPVLLEVNSNPSMRIEHEQEVSAASSLGAFSGIVSVAVTSVSVFKVAPGVFKYVPSPVDKEVKVSVIRDTLRLMDPGHKKPFM